MPIGAHVSTAGGLSTSMGRAQAIGAECTQIFLSTPHRWAVPTHSDEEVSRFCELGSEFGIAPNFAHAAYLLNLAAAGDSPMWQRSIDTLAACAEWCDRCQLEGIVVHVGSGRGQSIDDAVRQVSGALDKVLAAGARTRVLLENSAGSGELLGSRFNQIGAIFDNLGRDPRLGLCMDTAHTFASGYDLRAADGIQQTVDEIDQHIGLDRLRVIHANDSKVGLGSAVDRHENIGHGQLGEAAFVQMLAHPALRDVPWVLEVPGYEDKGPDEPNVTLLKQLARR
jgi:deoxyribonuclease-4